MASFTSLRPHLADHPPHLLAGFRVLLTVLGIIAFPPGSFAAGTYSVVDLGTLAQGGPVVIRGLNDAGDIVGSGMIADGQRAFVLNRTRLRNAHPDPRSDSSAANGINAGGAIVGTQNGPTSVRGFLIPPGQPPVELGPLPGDTGSEAFGISPSGEAAGLSSGPTGTRAVRWTVSAVPQALDSLPFASESRAVAINNRGTLVGTSGKRAVSWSGTAVQPLAALPGDTSSEALSINERGQIVGSSGDAASRHAVLWEAGAAPLDLGVLTGGASSRAVSINDVSEVVGTSESLLGSRAVIWTRTSGLKDLNDLLSDVTGLVLTHAAAINNLGAIVAIGRDDTGQGADHAHDLHEHPVRVFLLLPIP